MKEVGTKNHVYSFSPCFPCTCENRVAGVTIWFGTPGWRGGDGGDTIFLPLPLEVALLLHSRDGGDSGGTFLKKEKKKIIFSHNTV